MVAYPVRVSESILAVLAVLACFSPTEVTLPMLQTTSNVAFGDDGSSLYITGGTSLLRVRLTSKGVGF
jgi:sugar lactone lactonase YvrE